MSKQKNVTLIGIVGADPAGYIRLSRALSVLKPDNIILTGNEEDYQTLSDRLTTDLAIARGLIHKSDRLTATQAEIILTALNPTPLYEFTAVSDYIRVHAQTICYFEGQKSFDFAAYERTMALLHKQCKTAELPLEIIANLDQRVTHTYNVVKRSFDYHNPNILFRTQDISLLERLPHAKEVISRVKERINSVNGHTLVIADALELHEDYKDATIIGQLCHNIQSIVGTDFGSSNKTLYEGLKTFKPKRTLLHEY